MIRIGIVGAPSTGKTTLAEGISFHYKSNGRLNRVALITEYAREFVKDFGFPTTADQKHILDKQLENEKMADGASLMVTDSPFWLSYVYACHVLNISQNPNRDNYYLNQIHKSIINRLHDYDLLIYLPFDPLFCEKITVTDGQRIHTNPEIISNIDAKILGFMNLHDIEYNVIQETNAEKRLIAALSLVESIFGKE